MTFIPSKPNTKDNSNFIFKDGENFSILNGNKEVFSLYPSLKEQNREIKKMSILPERFVGLINLFTFKTENDILLVTPKFDLQSLDFFLKIEKLIQLISEYSFDKSKELKLFELNEIFCKNSNIFETDLGTCILSCLRRIFQKMTFAIVLENNESYLSVSH